MTVTEPAEGKVATKDANLTYLVTGGTGFMGRHLVAQLRSRGKNARTVSLSDGFDLLKDDLPLNGVDHVFHLAGRTGVLKAWKEPLLFFETNVHGTARVLDQCRRKGCSLTFVSSFLDGTYAGRPGSELELGNAVNPYAFSKLVAEQTCAFYARSLAVRVVTVRITNVYGPGQSLRFVVPHILSQLLNVATPEIVVQDLAPLRDYIYVLDAISGIVASTGAPAGSVFDLGSGVLHSVEDVVRLATRASGIYKPFRAIGARRVNEIRPASLDSVAARDLLGWKPLWSLEAGILATIESLRS